MTPSEAPKAFSGHVVRPWRTGRARPRGSTRDGHLEKSDFVQMTFSGASKKKHRFFCPKNRCFYPVWVLRVACFLCVRVCVSVCDPCVYACDEYTLFTSRACEGWADSPERPFLARNVFPMQTC